MVFRFEAEEEGERSLKVSLPGFNPNALLIPMSMACKESFSFGEFVFWLETQEWKDKYQDSLSLRVSQQFLEVYYLMPIKRGKNNSRVLVIDDDGVTYSLLIPTFSSPKLGQGLKVLRCDLTVISIVPAMDFLDKVKEVRTRDSLL
jgi:hypothetical protein